MDHRHCIPSFIPGPHRTPTTELLRSGAPKGTLSVVASAVIWTGIFAGGAGEPEPVILERFPPIAADEAIATMAVHPGFKIELAAAEPLVRDPIEMCFDEDSRLYVVEMIDYSEMRNEEPHWGRIRRLEDRDGDGRFERSIVFADNLPWPTGVFCAQGGIYVAATPDLWFFRDRDGDGHAEERRLVLTGFGADYAPFAVDRLNVQAMVNSLRWGLDNRIYGVTGPNGGRLQGPKHPELGTLNARGHDFALDPLTWKFTLVAGGGQYGQSFDDYGRRFTCNNSDHIRLFLHQARYEDRNPFHAMPPPLASIAADGPAAPVFRRSPDEPWRVVRTRWRVAGLVSGPIEGGGRPSGYFTSATGIMIYRGDAWPVKFRGDAFIADCGSNLVHHKSLHPDGISMLAERPPDEEGREFLASTDTWFRPVQLANGPDGALYVIDMYREIIEHPWSLPPGIKEQLDLNNGNDRGRIYRIVPENFHRRPWPCLGEATTGELVAMLAHPNAWHRETAARLLYEGQDRAAAVPLMKALLLASDSPLGRLHALYGLQGMGSLDAATLVKVLKDPSPRLREHAIRLSEFHLPPHQESPEDILVRELLDLASDPDPRVRHQLALTAGFLPDPPKIQILENLIRRHAANERIRAAVLNSLATGAGHLFARLSVDAAWLESANAPQILSDLAGIVGKTHREVEIKSVKEFLQREPQPAVAIPVAVAFFSNIPNSSSVLTPENTAKILSQAKHTARDRDSPPTVRLPAIALLGLFPNASDPDILLHLVESREPREVQLAAVRALGSLPPNTRLAGAMLGRWPLLTPRTKAEILRVLLQRTESAHAVLNAIAAGNLRPTDLTSSQTEFLLRHRNPELRAKANQYLAGTTASPPTPALEALLPALRLPGNPAAGKTIFLERCQSCHRLAGEGFPLGPDLASIWNTGKEKTLLNILDPNREVLPQYLAYEIEAENDFTYIGIITRESSTSVTLRQAYGIETTIPRAEIQSIRSQNRSLMPDGLTADLTLQDLANLLAFLFTADTR